MRIGITGATGFLGRHVIRQAQGGGHELVAYTRSQLGLPVLLASQTLAQPKTAPHELPETKLDARVHLAGESLMGLWTAQKRERIWKSRVEFTQGLVRHLSTWKAENRQRVLVCASGAGFYGDRGDDLLDEDSPSGAGFLAKLCMEWEKAAKEAEKLGMRVVMLRTGMVLGPDGGALSRGGGDSANISLVLGSLFLARGNIVGLGTGFVTYDHGGKQHRGVMQWAMTVVDGKPYFVDAIDPAAPRLVPLGEANERFHLRSGRYCHRAPDGSKVDKRVWQTTASSTPSGVGSGSTIPVTIPR